jgi:O-antigen/teichoic acid export membrane protein
LPSKLIKNLVSESEIKQQTSKNIAKSIGYGFLSWILPIGLTIYATPKILNGLGHTDYGVFALILGFISYSFTFSIGRTSTKYIAEFRQTNESDKIQSIISATLFLNLIVGFCGAVFIIVSANWLTVDVFKIEQNLQNTTNQAFYLAAATIFVMMLSQVFSGIVQGFHRFDVYSNILNFNSFSTIIGNIVLVYFQQGVLALLAWNLLTTTITCILYFTYSNILIPELKLGYRYSRELFRLVFRFSLGIVAYQVFGNLTFLVERGLITREFGTENLTYYVLPMTLALYIHGVISSLTLVIFPLASELTNEREKLLTLYSKSTKIVCVIVFFIAASLITTSSLFLTLWLGSDISAKSTDLLIIHTLTFSILAISIISWQLREGLGFAITNGFLGFSWFIIAVPLMLLWGKKFGLEGIGIARLIGLLPIILATFYFEKKIFGKLLFSFWAKLLLILSFTAALTSFTEHSILNNMPATWSTLIISGFCGGIVFLTSLWLLRFFTEDEKLFFRKLVKR